MTLFVVLFGIDAKLHTLHATQALIRHVTWHVGGLGAIANQVAREEDGDGKGASMDSVKQVSRQHIKLAPLPLEKKGMQ